MNVRDSRAAREYLNAPMPAKSTPWRELDFTVVDLETTGLNPSTDEIVSFATVTVSKGRVSLADASYELVRPKRMPGEDTSRIHGLREVDLIEAPPLEDLLEELLDALAGRILVAHVAAIEQAFLEKALAASGLQLRNRFVDTAKLSSELNRLRRERSSERATIGLSELAKSLGLPVHRRHTADGDALTTAQAFIALATHLDAFEEQTAGSLMRASGERPGLLARLRSRLRL
jgi:DNA polymerase III subunit epsilon